VCSVTAGKDNNGNFEEFKGDIVTATVTGAAPHHLIADGGPHSHRCTRAGDAHAAGRKPSTGVGLGMPGIGVPAPQPTSSGCAR
jgi:tRNA-2-methylthio-N6-dimethylallyladenosine synthase